MFISYVGMFALCNNTTRYHMAGGGCCDCDQTGLSRASRSTVCINNHVNVVLMYYCMCGSNK